jgi:hypothetical protein
MGTASAFLGNIQVLIEVNGIIRASINTILTASAFYRVQDYQTIFSLIKSSFNRTRFHARSIVTMLAQYRHIMHLDLGHCSSNKLILFQPELPGVRLRLGVWGPIIRHVFIFAGNLTAITSIAD